MNSFKLVKKFHKAFGHPVNNILTVPDEKLAALRLELINEEFEELKIAIANDDMIAVADALGDLEYVINGAAVAFGINLPAVVKEIHRSNMSKLGKDGKPIYREDGKVMKGENYFPPDLVKVLV